MNGTCNTLYQCSSTVSDIITPACNVSITRLGDNYACCIDTKEQQQAVLQAYNKIQTSSVGIACGGTGRSNSTIGGMKRGSLYKLFLLGLMLNFITWLIAGVGASALNKRDIKCKSFKIKSQQDSVSAAKKVSVIVNCGGQGVPCAVKTNKRHKDTADSTFYSPINGRVNVANVENTFGMNYTKSEIISEADGYLIPVNQCGYLESYSLSTLFKGTWTECDGQDLEGEANVIRKNAQQNRVTLTTC